MTKQDTDILIAGGGVAGLTAAAAFGAAGFRVICVDPATPVTEGGAEGADLRSTAFLQPSVAVLERAGLWERLAPQAMPLQVMRIVDAGGEVPEPRVTHDFDAAEISDRPFGWNILNWQLRREMVARLSELPHVDFRPGVGFDGATLRESAAIARLSDGARVSARLLVGADGRNSGVRRELGIGVRTARYGQKALAFAVTHPVAHENVSTEIHRSGGPFTLVPLPDRDGMPCSAIVWMERGAEVRRLQELDKAGFEAEMTERSCHLFGRLSLASRLTVWPIIAQVADRVTGQRTALMAEAAHVVPPIGAQGLNMSLADLGTLLDLATDRPDELGGARMLDAYARRRRPEVAARTGGVDLLDRVSMLSAQPLRDMRAAVLDALYSSPALRRGLMRAGMGMR